MLLFLHSFRNLILVVDFANGAHRGTHQLHVPVADHHPGHLCARLKAAEERPA